MEACLSSPIGSPGRCSEGTNPLDLKWASSSTLSISSRANQTVFTSPPPSVAVVVVSNIQLTFDPKALPVLGDRTPLFATLELLSSSTPTPSPQRHTTAEMRPVVIAPAAAVVSWYQCWHLPMAGDVSTAELLVSLSQRTAPRKAVLPGSRTEFLFRAVIPLAALPLNEASTQRVGLPFGGTLSVVLQLSTVTAATAPPARSSVSRCVLNLW
eukprot:RCo037189